MVSQTGQNQVLKTFGEEKNNRYWDLTEQGGWKEGQDQKK